MRPAEQLDASPTCGQEPETANVYRIGPSFITVPEAAIFDRALSGSDWQRLCLIGQRANKDTGAATGNQREMARRLGEARETFSRRLKRLAAYISHRDEKKRPRWDSTHLYTLDFSGSRKVIIPARAL